MARSIARGRVLSGLLALAVLLPATALRAQETPQKPQAREVLAQALAQAKATERLVFLHSGAHW